jgi:hypothetical protein
MPQQKRSDKRVRVLGKGNLSFMDEIKEICFMIGCSKMDEKCPGNPSCSILHKLMPPSYIGMSIPRFERGGAGSTPAGGESE